MKTSEENVLKAQKRHMWLRIDMPETLSTAAEQKITIEINATQQ